MTCLTPPSFPLPLFFSVTTPTRVEFPASQTLSSVLQFNKSSGTEGTESTRETENQITKFEYGPQLHQSGLLNQTTHLQNKKNGSIQAYGCAFGFVTGYSVYL
jgi:hypothetical protein